MNRCAGVWTAIICILAVGIFVTRTTSKFVSSKETEIGAGMVAEAEGAAEWRMAGAAKTGAAMALDAVPAPKAAEEAPAFASETTTEKLVEAGTVIEETKAGFEDKAAFSGTEAAGQEAAAEEADMAEIVSETAGAVAISPLDTAAAEENTGARTYSAKELRERLDAVLERVMLYGETAPDDPGRQYMMAEFEYTLWSEELNLISQSMRQKMSDEEAERFRVNEVEWHWNRTVDAERAVLKNGAQTAKETGYMKELAEETKERCYQLVNDYEEILDR